MIEKEYTVIVKQGIDLTEIEAELTASTGEGPIPKRSVDIANARPGSRRQTHFMLTDEEAQLLKNDPRILDVEIPPDQRTDIQIGLKSTQLSNFTKPITLDSNQYVNWGMKRTVMPTNLYGDSKVTNNRYEYALQGRGVDLVVQDSGLEPTHPDFQSADGTNRYQYIDWYEASGLPGSQSPNYHRDFDGHGTLCASIVAGKTYGFAKEANIYSMKIAGLEGTGDAGTGISPTNCFDAIRLWHEAKPIDPATGYKRPTIINASWGYFSQLIGDPTSGNYRGTSWVYGVDYSNDGTLWLGTGLVVPLSGSTRFIPLRVSSIDADVEDAIDSGIHVFIAAGNDYFKGDISTGLDYNNTVVYGSSTYFYHRGSSPHSDEAFIVGNINTNTYNDNGVDKDRTASSSSRGPRVNIWAPGTNIVAATSTINNKTDAEYPLNENFRIGINSGTSFAAPQVCGVAGLHLEAQPGATPAQLKTKMEADAKPLMYDGGTDYNQISTNLMGASNKILFSRYARQPVEVNGANLKLQEIFPNYTPAEVPAVPVVEADPEYNNGAIINVVGDGSDFFKREVTVNGVRIMGAGTVGGQTAVPDAWLEKVARMFELFTDPNGAGINEEYQRNLIKTLSGDTGTYHAGLPTIQRVARGAGSDYSTNFLTDAGIIFWNLTDLFDTTVQNDMVWYLNSTGGAPGDGDQDAQEVIEHVFHTIHMHGLPADDIKLYQFLAADWNTGDLYNAMVEAYDAGKWDPSGYNSPADAFKTDPDAFEVAAKEYLYLLNFCMFEYTSLWEGGSLAPEWTDDMRTQAGIQTNNPLGYAFHNTYIAPVISKPSLATIRNIFQDGDVGDPTVAGPSGYVPD